jgi:hypothetical protein
MKWLLMATGLGIPYLRKKIWREDTKKAAYMTSSWKSIKIKLIFGCHLSKIKFLVHVQNKKRIVQQDDFNFSHLIVLCHFKTLLEEFEKSFRQMCIEPLAALF